MKRPFLLPLLLALSGGLSARYPLWLFGLRLAAQLSSAMLLVFGGFLLLLQPGWPVLVYAVLMLAFGAINIAALYRLKTARDEPRRLCLWAHICSALLPLTYALGILLNIHVSSPFKGRSVLGGFAPLSGSALPARTSCGKCARRMQLPCGAMVARMKKPGGQVPRRVCFPDLAAAYSVASADVSAPSSEDLRRPRDRVFITPSAGSDA